MPKIYIFQLNPTLEKDGKIPPPMMRDRRFLSVRKVLSLSCPNAWIHQAWNQHQLHHPNVSGSFRNTGEKTNLANNKICFQWQYDHLSVLNLKKSNIRHKIHDRSSFSQTSDMSCRFTSWLFRFYRLAKWKDLNSLRSFQIDVEMPIAPPTMVLSLVSPKLKWKPTGCQLETTPRL